MMGFTSGIAIGWTSPILPKLVKLSPANPLDRAISSDEGAWIAGFMPVGALIGPLVAGQSADKLGRKRTLLMLACPMIASFLVAAFARNVALLYVSRFLVGLGTGGSFTTLPMFLGEIAENHNRGRLGCTMGIFVATGLFFTYAVGPFLSIQNFCLVCIVPSVIFVVVFTIWIPDTPLYLASIGDQNALETSLVKFRNRPAQAVQKELADLVSIVQESKRARGGFRDLIKSRISRRALIIIIGLIILLQFAGISAVLSYMQTIFDGAGTKIAPEINPIIVGFVQMCSTIVASFLVDHVGRRILLLISSIGCCLPLISLGVYFHLQTNQFDVDAIFWLPVVSLVVFITAYNIGLRPIPWAMMGELFPPNVKHVASTLGAITFFAGGLIITILFPSLSEALGMAWSFWIFAILCVIGTLFIFQMVPETKGKSLQQIQVLLQGRKE
jgi:sugar porter (SP) family MFS transporter